MLFYCYNKIIKIVKLFIFILIIYVIFKLKYINNNIFIKVSFSIWKAFITFYNKWNDIKTFLFIKFVKRPVILLYFLINY